MFFFSSRRRHTRYIGDWSSDVCSSDLLRCGFTDKHSRTDRALAVRECLSVNPHRRRPRSLDPAHEPILARRDRWPGPLSQRGFREARVLRSVSLPNTRRSETPAGVDSALVSLPPWAVRSITSGATRVARNVGSMLDRDFDLRQSVYQ